MSTRRITLKTLRKSVTINMILVLCVAVLAGCMKNQIASPTASPTGSPTVLPTVSPTATPIASPIQQNANAIQKELAFVYNGNRVAISDIVDDEKLESILGKAEEKKSHTYSKDDGLNMDTLIGFTEKQYKFLGLGIKTINAAEDKNFYIFNIKITNSRYSTIRNIKVGDSVEMLKEAYPEGNMIGNGTAEEEDDFQYIPVNYVDGMKFHIKNKMIESILMYKLLD